MPTPKWNKKKKQKGRRKMYLRKKKNGNEKNHHIAHQFGEEFQSKKMLRIMIGSFLRKVKEKNKKRRSFKSRLKTTRNQRETQLIVLQIEALTLPTGTCHVATTYGVPPLRI